MTTAPSVAVVVPVHDGVALLSALLSALAAQVLAPAEVVVVDDRSTDGTAGVARAAGARVIAGGGGPYQSRNTGWRATDTELVAFVDVRSRPAPGWLAATSALFLDPSVAMGTTETTVVGAESLVERASVQQQVFDVRTYVDAPWFLPYFATCNLLVRRSALEVVDGFAEVRSGGDADLCWRVQLAGLGSVAVAREPLMTWQARNGLRDAFEQTHRYGRSRVELSRRFADRGAPAPVVAPAATMFPYVIRAALALGVRQLTRLQPDAAARNLLAVYRGSTWLGSRRELRRHSGAPARQGGPG